MNREFKLGTPWKTDVTFDVLVETEEGESSEV